MVNILLMMMVNDDGYYMVNDGYYMVNNNLVGAWAYPSENDDAAT